MPPRVSVVIPTWNEEQWLPRLLESLRAGTPVHEIIVADNDSTDRTREVAREFGCVVVPGGRPGPARNRGAAAASGEILVFIDADVVVGPGIVDTVVETLSQPGVVAQHFKLRPIAASPFVRLCYQVMSAYFTVLASLGQSQGIGPFIAVEAEAFHRIGGFQEDIDAGEDADFFRRLNKVGKIRYDRRRTVLTSARRFDVEPTAAYVFKTLFWGALRITGRKASVFSYRWQAYPADLARREALEIEKLQRRAQG